MSLSRPIAARKVLEIGRVGRKEAAEHDRLRRLEAGQRLGGRATVISDRVADAGVGDLLDLGGDVADFAGTEFGGLGHFRTEDADAVDLVDGVRGHHADAPALPEGPVYDPDQDNHAEIGVVPGIDEQGLERRRLVALGRGQALDDRLEHETDVEAGLGRDRHRVRSIETDHVLDLLLDPLGLGGRQVDLVEHRHNLVPGVERVIDVGQRLRLDPLARVDHQERALAGGERTRHFVGEVDVARRVHEVEDIGLAVLGPVFEAHRLRLDGDAALALDVHGIEHLLDHVALRHCPGLLDEPVGQRRLAVVDMGDDREVADVLDAVGGHGARDSRTRRARERDSSLAALGYLPPSPTGEGSGVRVPSSVRAVARPEGRRPPDALRRGYLLPGEKGYANGRRNSAPRGRERRAYSAAMARGAFV